MDNQKYIKVSAIYKKLRQAETQDVPIYISGAVAFGKSAAVEYFYRKKAHVRLSGSEGYLDDMPELEGISQDVVVIDDISWITDTESMQYILQMIRHRREYGKHIVLIGRGRLPGWLRVIAVEEEFVQAGESDLMLNKEEVTRFLESRGINPSEEELSQIMADTYGHPLTLIYLAYHLTTNIAEQNGNDYSTAIVNQVQLDLFHYYDHAFYEKWDVEMREVLLAVCQYETFTIQMTEMITGNNRIPKLFEKAMTVGTFLIKQDNENYSYRIQLRRYFRWKQELLYTTQQKKDNFQRAAWYYELQEDIQKALKYYKAAGNEHHIAELLIKNARKHPGTAHFFETREYYLSLPEKTILESPVLMSGMSMLYAMMLKPEESKYWYDRLVEYEENAEHGSQEKKEAKNRIAYLNIGLPQKGIHDMMAILKSTAVLCLDKKIQLPEFSITSNMPSIMNGGLDFSEWSRSDRELCKLMKKPIEIVLGKHGAGLINIALAESGLEKATMDAYEIITRLNNGYHMSDADGRIEMSFAATGLLIKEHMLNGQPKLSESLYDSFLKKAQQEKAAHLFPNMRTLHMWIKLMQGDLKEPEVWIMSAPDDIVAFCTLDRYQYIGKVRCLMALDRKEEALGLIERLTPYFTQYERHYLWMESQILKSILLYRLEQDEWQETLDEVLHRAEHYRFIRVFSMEGSALKPLLDRIQKTEVDTEYLDGIRRETEQMAVYYPNYLKVQTATAQTLTETEKRILKLMCSGVSSKEICELCGFAYSGFKFHAHNIYVKLQVKRRADAEREAIRLGLDR